MTNLPTILICPVSAKDGINAVLEALGRGPNNISRKLCAVDSEATYETPATHYMMQDMSATDADMLLWTGMKAGILPDTVEWGEEGIISSEQDAIAACAAMNLYSAAQDFKLPWEWCADVLASVDLQFVPDEPI